MFMIQFATGHRLDSLQGAQVFLGVRWGEGGWEKRDVPVEGCRQGGTASPVSAGEQGAVSAKPVVFFLLDEAAPPRVLRARLRSSSKAPILVSCCWTSDATTGPPARDRGSKVSGGTPRPSVSTLATAVRPATASEQRDSAPGRPPLPRRAVGPQARGGGLSSLKSGARRRQKGSAPGGVVVLAVSAPPSPSRDRRGSELTI
ncbi:hypothetical protein NDU88_000613 [Pleurodeles waltl]|uniref:Uncharacterized protein n=1 Tax=Pleurodeles waltl TaxID=8319 RepID=A0AAV7TFZ1_PLEWA|nr:hypothetical protein NDU88_000613 [Pleurodeles waltl]